MSKAKHNPPEETHGTRHRLPSSTDVKNRRKWYRVPLRSTIGKTPQKFLHECRISKPFLVSTVPRERKQELLDALFGRHSLERNAAERSHKLFRHLKRVSESNPHPPATCAQRRWFMGRRNHELRPSKPAQPERCCSVCTNMQQPNTLF